MKNLFFTLIFVWGLIAVAGAETTNPSNGENPDVCWTCNAPPPDSFRAVTIGGTYFELAWKPAWPGALHYLTIEEQDGNAQWISKFVFPNVSGNHFTVTGLNSGRYYRFRIATKCGNGEPSELSASFDDRSTILELTLAGRVPVDPVPISGVNIPYGKFNWVGFQISDGENSNLFEVEVSSNNSPDAYIRKVFDPNNIVAGKFALPSIIYPTILKPVITEVPAVFPMVKLPIISPLESIIGEIEYSKSNGTMTIKIYAGQFPWKNEYSFVVLKADSALPSPSGNFVVSGNNGSDGIKILNPIGDMFRMSLPISKENNEGIKLTLFNLEGGLERTWVLQSNGEEVELPMYDLASGVYIAQIKTAEKTVSSKIIKL